LGPSATIKRPTSPVRLELANALAADYQWMFYRHYSASQERRQAAVKLAERLFELKNGRLPQPDQLVPDYLPSLPVDRIPNGLTLAGRVGAIKPTSRPSSN